ncbi:hypothetical protein [Thermomonas sp.]|uniref:hypothetical protein n=1 Tax=Thermomonas sp. TaxID=1971895 RepID=UPI003D0E3C5E
MRAIFRRLLAALCAALLFVALLAYQRGVEPPHRYVVLDNGEQVETNLAVWNFVVQIGIMIVSALLSYALAPKPQPPKPASITDFDVPTAEEGREIPVVFGTVWVTGPNVLWYGDLGTAPIQKKSGKK